MNRGQEAAIVRAFIEELGPDTHTGTEAFGAFLRLQSARSEIFAGIPADAWQPVHALLNRRGLTRG